MAVNLSKFPIMQLCYILEYAQAWRHGSAYLTGWLCIIVFSVCLVCRIVFGPNATDSTPGRMLVLFGALLDCMAHHFLEWYGERKIKYWHGEREKCFANKDKPASDMLNRWQFPGASTSDFFRAFSTISLMRYQLSLLLIAIFVTSVAA